MCKIIFPCIKLQIQEDNKLLNPHLIQQFSSICVMETRYGRELLSNVKGSCITHPQGKGLMNTAKKCLHICPRKRITAIDLLYNV